MTKRRTKKKSLSQIAFQVMGITLAIFMVISLVLVALPTPPPPEPTRAPTITSFPRPTDTATPPPSPTPLPTDTPTPLPTTAPVGPEVPTGTPTEPAIGPQLPTETPEVTPTPSADAAPPNGGAFLFAVVGDSRSRPKVYRRILEAVSADSVVYLYTSGGGAPLYTEGHPLAFHHYLRIKVQGQDVTIEVVEI